MQTSMFSGEGSQCSTADFTPCVSDNRTDTSILIHPTPTLHHRHPQDKYIHPHVAQLASPFYNSDVAHLACCFFPTILWCWVFVLKRQRPASLTPSSSPSSLLPLLAFALRMSLFRHTQHSASWPHRELHLRSQWRRPHAVRAPFWHTPHKFRGPMGSPTQGSNGRDRMCDAAQFGIPLTHFVWPHRELYRRLQ